MALIVYSRLDGRMPRWLETGRSGAPIGGVREGLPPAGQAKRVCYWVVWGEDVLLTTTRLAMRSAAELERALPYAIEEALAVDVDDVVVGFTRQDGGQAVVAGSADDLGRGLASLAAAGLSVRRVVPDVLLLPHQDGHWTLAGDGERALVRHGRAAGFACERSVLDWSLDRLWRGAPDDDRPAGLILAGEAAPEPGGELAGMPTATAAGSLLELFADGIEKSTAPGLPQHEGGVGAMHRGSLRRFALAAGLGLLAFGVAAGTTWWENRALGEVNKTLQARIDGVFTRSFPGRRVQDARLQMQQALARVGDGDADAPRALSMLAALAAPYAAEKQLEIERLEYRAGQLSLSLRGQDVTQLERIKQVLERDRLEVEIGSVQAGADGVRAQLRIRQVAA